MKDPFFADIDWNLLEKRILDPPIILQKKSKNKKAIKMEKEKEEISMLFEDPNDSDSD